MADTTMQETFDKVATHLLTQNKKSGVTIETRFNCMYRGPNGLMCAIGCLIPDELYDSEMDCGDGMTADTLLETYFPLKQIFRNLPLGFLKDLQALHDFYPEYKWREQLVEFAAKYKLSVDRLVAL